MLGPSSPEMSPFDTSLDPHPSFSDEQSYEETVTNGELLENQQFIINVSISEEISLKDKYTIEVGRTGSEQFPNRWATRSGL